MQSIDKGNISTFELARRFLYESKSGNISPYLQECITKEMVNFEETDVYGENILMYACRGDQSCRIIVDDTYWPKLTRFSISGSNTLMGPPDNDLFVETLLKAGADPNFQSSIYRDTPLTVSVICRRPSTVKLLLMLGVSPNQSNCWGSALSMAILGCQLEIAEILIDAGASIDEIINKRTPLDWIDMTIDWYQSRWYKMPNEIDICMKIKQRILEVQVRSILVTFLSKLPIELAELCGDFIVFNKARRDADKRACPIIISTNNTE